MEMNSSCLDLDEEPMCCDLSPSAPLLATGLVSGKLMLHTYAFDDPGSGSKGEGRGSGKNRPQLRHTLAHTVQAHSGEHSCRAATFAYEGASVATGSSDHSMGLFDAATAKLVHRTDAAHTAELSSLLSVGSYVVASGDEAGLIKLWDLRQGSSVYSYKKHSDYVSGFGLHAREQCLLAVSGDGTLSVHDMRGRKARLRTEDDADDELLSVCVVKGGKKVLAGTQSGVLNIYSWGAMADCSDRFPGHPESVDAIVKFDEDTVLTGSSDGAIRIIGVLPNRMLGLLGQHSELPVECLALSSDRRVLASASHDHSVKLWDLSELVDGDGDEDEGMDEDGVDEGEGGGGGACVRVAAARVVGAGGTSVAAAGAVGAGGTLDAEDGDEGEGESEGCDEEPGDEDAEDGDESGDTESSSGGHSGSEGLGSDSEGVEEGEGQAEEGEEEAAEARAGQRSAAAAKRSASAAALAAAAQAFTSGSEGGKLAGDDGGDSDSDSDDDDDVGKRKSKRAKPEKTKWRKGEEPSHGAGPGNFFADLL